MRAFINSLSAGERFSALVIAIAFFSVMIPAALEYSRQAAATPPLLSQSQ